MKHFAVLAAALFAVTTLQAQPAAIPVTKLAVTSLIGDVMTVDVYRKRVGTNVDKNLRTTVPTPGPVFDLAALQAAERAAGRALPQASVQMLAVPAAQSANDPALLLHDGKLVEGSPLIAGLKEGGFSHLLLISKLRAPARLKLANETTGSGMLEGIGFYIDYFLRVRRGDTGETGEGFIAPYVYIQMTLVDLQSLQVVAQRAITASAARAAARNPDGFDPWGAMTAEQKVTMLQRMVRGEVAAAVPLLLQQSN